jgi:hypothetical protein
MVWCLRAASSTKRLAAVFLYVIGACNPSMSADIEALGCRGALSIPSGSSLSLHKHGDASKRLRLRGGEGWNGALVTRDLYGKAIKLGMTFPVLLAAVYMYRSILSLQKQFC